MLFAALGDSGLRLDPQDPSGHFYAVEFSIFAMVLGYPRAEPVTQLEQVYAIAMLLLMGAIYTYAIGAVCGILATMDPASTEYRTKRDLVRTWSDEMCASAELKEQLLEYMEECRLVIRQRYYHGLLDTLSPMLQQKVAQHQHSGWLTRVAFFQCEDRAERRRAAAGGAEERRRRGEALRAVGAGLHAVGRRRRDLVRLRELRLCVSH